MPEATRVTVPPLPFGDESLTEIWACHMLEHLEPDQARDFLAECWRALRPGGALGLVVPDTREIMRRSALRIPTTVEYPQGNFLDVTDLDAVCELFLYSSLQPSGHRWSFDSESLRRLIERAGFQVVSEIDRWHDPRIPVGAWYQVGLQAVKPIGLVRSGT